MARMSTIGWPPSATSFATPGSQQRAIESWPALSSAWSIAVHSVNYGSVILIGSQL